MAAQLGSAILLKVDSDGAGTYQTMAGLRTKTLTLNSEPVDITNSDSVNKWRELLAGAGIKSLSVSGQGVFTDAASENTAHTYLLNGTIRNWQIVVPGLGTYTALMQISQLEYAGEHNGEVTYQLTLESAGAVSFA